MEDFNQILKPVLDGYEMGISTQPARTTRQEGFALPHPNGVTQVLQNANDWLPPDWTYSSTSDSSSSPRTFSGSSLLPSGDCIYTQLSMDHTIWNGSQSNSSVFEEYVDIVAEGSAPTPSQYERYDLLSEEGQDESDDILNNYLRDVRPREDSMYYCEDVGAEDHSCQFVHERRCMLRKHLEQTLKINVCNHPTCKGQAFSSKVVLTRHEREAHGMHQAKQYFCPDRSCERAHRGFAREYNMADHIARIHKELDPKQFLKKRTRPNTKSASGFSAGSAAIPVDIAARRRTSVEPRRQLFERQFHDLQEKGNGVLKKIQDIHKPNDLQDIQQHRRELTWIEEARHGDNPVTECDSFNGFVPAMKSDTCNVSMSESSLNQKVGYEELKTDSANKDGHPMSNSRRLSDNTKQKAVFNPSTASSMDFKKERAAFESIIQAVQTTFLDVDCEEDSTKITDLVGKQRIPNRIAQRHYGTSSLASPAFPSPIPSQTNPADRAEGEKLKAPIQDLENQVSSSIPPNRQGSPRKEQTQNSAGSGQNPARVSAESSSTTTTASKPVPVGCVPFLDESVFPSEQSFHPLSTSPVPAISFHIPSAAAARDPKCEAYDGRHSPGQNLDNVKSILDQNDGDDILACSAAKTESTKPNGTATDTRNVDTSVIQVNTTDTCGRSIAPPLGSPSEMSETSETSSITSSSFQSLSSNEDPDQRGIHILLCQWRRQMTERIMEELQALFGRQPPFRGYADSCQSNSPEDSTAQNYNIFANNPQDSPKTPNDKKRSHSQYHGRGSQDDQEDGEEEDEQNPTKRNIPSDGSKVSPQCKLACPYYQRNPLNHAKFPSCSGPGWVTVHRVKEHVYRRHALPPHCLRCYTTFTNIAELKEHARGMSLCETREPVVLHGFDKEQEQKLRKRKRSMLTEVEKWKDMYKILFPDDDDDKIPSPFYARNTYALRTQGVDELTQYDRFLQEQLPVLVQSEFDRFLLQKSIALEEQMKSKLVDIIRSCQSKLYASYEKANFRLDTVAGDDRSSSVLNLAGAADSTLAAYAPLESLPGGAQTSIFDSSSLFDASWLDGVDMTPLFSDSAYGSQRLPSGEDNNECLNSSSSMDLSSCPGGNNTA